MNIWENFGTFYQSLDIGGLVVVWGFLFVFLFFMVATFLLFSKNRELGKLLQEKTKKVSELEAEKRTLWERKKDKVAVKDLDKDIKPVKEKQEATLEEEAIFTDDETDDAPVVNKNNINNNISINSKEDVSDKGKMICNVTDKDIEDSKSDIIIHDDEGEKQHLPADNKSFKATVHKGDVIDVDDINNVQLQKL